VRRPLLACKPYNVREEMHPLARFIQNPRRDHASAPSRRV